MSFKFQRKQIIYFLVLKIFIFRYKFYYNEKFRINPINQFMARVYYITMHAVDVKITGRLLY